MNFLSNLITAALVENLGAWHKDGIALKKTALTYCVDQWQSRVISCSLVQKCKSDWPLSDRGRLTSLPELVLGVAGKW